MAIAWTEQVALVTGGSRGIGRAIALELARAGAAVCVNYVTRASAASQVVEEITNGGGKAMAIAADVSDDADVEAMIDRIAAELGPVTILVNNAGISTPADLESYDRDALAHMREVNVDGVIHTTRAVMSGMRSLGYGRVVNVTSIAAIGTSLPGNAFYAATKAEIAILTKRFAMELGQYGVTVNAVAPGFIETEMPQHRRSATEWAETKQRIAEKAMLRRIGTPEDIANAVAFLAAPASGWITAQTLVVDGGRMDYI
ncbi:MAG: glucose 1-dehydrogenase [Acetobacteraceae bacterium]|nr:glucose 1-dehydrogenase [Acetobacteraceae bacterium]